MSVLTLARSSMIWPRRSPGRCSGMTRCASCPSWARRAPSRCPPGNAVAALLAGSAPSMYALALEDDGIERAVAAGAAI